VPASKHKIEGMLWKRAINIGTAVLAAAATPAVTYGLLNFFLGSYFYLLITYAVFIFALAHAAILGLPIYLILSQKRELTRAISIFAGFIVGSVPMTLISLPDPIESDQMAVIGSAAILGALGGFVFWLTLHILGKPDSATRHNSPFISLQTIFPLVLVITSIAILIIPTIS